MGHTAQVDRTDRTGGDHVAPPGPDVTDCARYLQNLSAASFAPAL